MEFLTEVFIEIDAMLEELEKTIAVGARVVGIVRVTVSGGGVATVTVVITVVVTIVVTIAVIVFIILCLLMLLLLL